MLLHTCQLACMAPWHSTLHAKHAVARCPYLDPQDDGGPLRRRLKCPREMECNQQRSSHRSEERMAQPSSRARLLEQLAWIQGQVHICGNLPHSPSVQDLDLLAWEIKWIK